jgi:hypothetical protein
VSRKSGSTGLCAFLIPLTLYRLSVIHRSLKELPDIYDRRLSACNKLESAEYAPLCTAAKLCRKKNKGNPSPATDEEKITKSARAQAQESSATDPERGTLAAQLFPDEKRPTQRDEEKTVTKSARAQAQESSAMDPERGTLAARLVPREKRPTHRLKLGFMPFSLPLIGEKVDSIEWSREEIRVCSELLDEGREAIESEDAGERIQMETALNRPILRVTAHFSRSTNRLALIWHCRCLRTTSPTK